MKSTGQEPTSIPVRRNPVFDDIERNSTIPASHGEPSFSFLNRVSGDYWDSQRRLIQEWADRLPEEDYLDTRNRLRSKDDYQFRSAFLELYLHETLLSSGFRVDIHPDLPGTSRHPDFYVEREGIGFYLEAISPGINPAEEAANKRRAVLFDTVNRLQDPNFFLWLSRLDAGPDQPASAKLRAKLKNWLASLDPDDYPDFARMPEWHWADNGWSATFKAIPKKANARQIRSTDRAIGVYAHTGARFIDDATTIMNALSEKHSAYGPLEAPFVIAVGLYNFDADHWHSMNAFYGHESYQLLANDEGEIVDSHRVREPNGYFGQPPEWKNRQVSAILLVNQLAPQSVLTAETTLWRHPDPRHILPRGLGLPWAEVILNEDHQLTGKLAPITTASLFGLPDTWPPGEPWPE
ncbi:MULTISPECIES: hypothetical protein [Nocardia]|uniref:hypothetical protein n=1 Tax=Nocardia TaxID=1817 RepID=UPI002454DFEC|nr:MULTISPECIES: hypothetical protein [Nocardia]